MKRLLPFTLIPPILFTISLFLPYIEQQFAPGEKIIRYGYEFPFVFFPLGVMLIILLVANFKRSRFTAIIAFVLCFGLLFSLFLLQFSMSPAMGDFTLHRYKFGYPFAFFSALLLMVILLVNLVKTFRNSHLS